MIKVFALAQFFTKSLLKNKATTIFTIFSIILLSIAYLLSSVNIIVRFKLFEDILLTSQGYLLLLCSLFYTFELITKDRLSGLFVLPLSFGVKRWEYLASLFLTLVNILSLLFLIFLLVDFVFLFFIEGKVTFLVLYQLYFYYLSSILFGFFVITFSQFVSITNSLIYSIAIFMVGNGLDELYVFSRNQDENLNLISIFLYYGFPNFSFFDIQSLVVNRAGIEIETLIFPNIYFVALSMILYGISLAKYEKKVLDVGY